MMLLFSRWNSKEHQSNIAGDKQWNSVLAEGVVCMLYGQKPDGGGVQDSRRTTRILCQIQLK
jgi:hypothetical protein